MSHLDPHLPPVLRPQKCGLPHQLPPPVVVNATILPQHKQVAADVSSPFLRPKPFTTQRGKMVSLVAMRCLTVVKIIMYVKTIIS